MKVTKHYEIQKQDDLNWTVNKVGVYPEGHKNAGEERIQRLSYHGTLDAALEEVLRQTADTSECNTVKEYCDLVKETWTEIRKEISQLPKK
jgi:hypothetical protein